ncbi:MAG: MBL fold metallo-hydrolase [Myxococcaceae bacterium]
MLVTWLGHAQLFLNAANRTLLLDPWFHEPVFGGAWFRYPPPPFANSSTLPRPDFLLLSHTHPDHSSLETLEQISRDSHLVVPAFHSMRKRISGAHFNEITWLEPYQTIELSPGLKVTYVQHDRGWEVGSIVVEADGVRLYHGNDNPLSVPAYQELVRRLGPIDLAFLPFAGASSYPTCFEGDAQTLARRCAEKKAEGLSRLLEGIEGLQPKEAAPFASSWALLEPGGIEKNFVDRPTPAEALRAAAPTAAKLGTHLLSLEPGDEWSPETGVLTKHLTDGWGYDVASVARYAKQEEARVTAALHQARVPGKPVTDAQLDGAFRAWFETALKETHEPIGELKMTAGFVTQGLSWRLTFEPGKPPLLEAGVRGDEDETLTLERGELWHVLAGPWNFEDVWYGYRVQVKKRNDTYYRHFWELLLNYDAEALSKSIARRFAT